MSIVIGHNFVLIKIQEAYLDICIVQSSVPSCSFLAAKLLVVSECESSFFCARKQMHHILFYSLSVQDIFTSYHHYYKHSILHYHNNFEKVLHSSYFSVKMLSLGVVDNSICCNRQPVHWPVPPLIYLPDIILQCWVFWLFKPIITIIKQYIYATGWCFPNCYKGVGSTVKCREEGLQQQLNSWDHTAAWN